MTAAEILERLLAVDGMQPLRTTPFLTDEPKLPVYITRIGEESWGQGAHTDPIVAQLKAAGEALERSCLLAPATEESVKARFGKLDGQIDPVDFYCYSREQTPNYDQQLELVRGAAYYWADVEDAWSGQKMLIPRELVYLDAGGLEERTIRRESTTSGAAIGVAGTGEAFGRALFELIERDAFMGVWLKKESPRRIGELSGHSSALVGLLDRYRLDCRVFDLRGPLGVPVVLALTLDHSGVGPAVTTGLGAGEGYDAAIMSAILESMSYRRQVRIKAMSDELPDVPQAEGVTSVETRIAFWSRPERLRELPAWADAPPTLPEAELAAVCGTVEQTLTALADRGYRVLRKSITTSEAEAQGFEAMRVIVPELHPLYLSEAARALHSEHLGSISMNGNDLPHPFA
jgi:thiazole/oxazole-forming peptide maturase SagD family component